MSKIALLTLDQLRYAFSLLGAQLVFLLGSAPKRECFGIRMTLSYGVCTLTALSYVPLYYWLYGHNSSLLIAVTAVYWLVLLLLTCLSQWYCFDLGRCNILFRCLVGGAMESIATTLVRSLLVTQLFPLLPADHPVLYILIMLTVYGAVYFAGWHLVGRPLQRNADTGIPEDRKTFLVYLHAHVGFCVLIMLCKTINEWTLSSFELAGQEGALALIRNFNIAVMLLAGTVILIMQYYVYAVGVLRAERDLFEQIMAEKAAQYERSKESIAAINRKCHDLKHQVLALQVASEAEREEMLRETERAIMFYDTAVKTGSEVLDTLLTEKSTICAYHNIRFSCSVQSEHLDRIGVVDLYTMLGNALDNAIESAEQLSQPDRKTISFSITERGKMLLIAVENYYDGTIQMRGGMPLTSKTDKSSHGIGVKSIRTLAQRYGGDVRIDTEDQIFLLQIMFPLSQMPQAG